MSTKCTSLCNEYVAAGGGVNIRNFYNSRDGERKTKTILTKDRACRSRNPCKYFDITGDMWSTSYSWSAANFRIKSCKSWNDRGDYIFGFQILKIPISFVSCKSRTMEDVITVCNCVPHWTLQYHFVFRFTLKSKIFFVCIRQKLK